MSDLISRAERFARVRHEGQFRKGKAKEPYTNHLVEVAALVERWSGSESSIAAAWLHDTVEDCPSTSVAELVSLFGNGVLFSMRDIQGTMIILRRKLFSALVKAL